MKCLNGKVSDLEKAASQRKAKLDENSAFLQFNWKADVVESWIGKRCLGESQVSYPPGPGRLFWSHSLTASCAVGFLLQRRNQSNAGISENPPPGQAREPGPQRCRHWASAGLS